MSKAREEALRRFKRLTEEMVADIRADSIKELNRSADELVAQMQAVAPLGRTGNLRRSIHKEPGERDTTVLIKAGGALTTVQSGRSGTPPYDYSMGVEFGTKGGGFDGSGNVAQPFFWPSYRLRKKRIRSALRRTITKNVKKRSAE